MPARGPASFLIALAKGDRAAAERILDTPGFNATELVRFSLRNQLGGYVYSHLGSLAEHSLFTDEILATLARCHRRQVEVSERTGSRLGEVVQLLETNDCNVLLLKGLYLASRFYGGLDQRTFWDIDLLTPEADFPHARRVLERAGFQRISGTFLGESLSRRFVHGFDFQRERCRVDLHWVLVAHPAIRFDYDRLWSEARPLEVAGVRVRVLPDDLMIATHLLSTFEDVQRGSFRLRSFVDIYRILRVLEPTTDWDRFLTDRNAEGLRQISISMLSLFLEAFDSAAEFPALATALSREAAAAGQATPPAADLMSQSTLGLRHKRWAASQYEMSSPRLFGWWLASLPFRVTVHQKDKLKRRLQGLGSRLTRGRAAA